MIRPLLLNDNGDFIIWAQAFLEACGGFGQAGKAIIHGVRNDPKFPLITDMVLDFNDVPTDIMKYDHSLPTSSSPMEFINDGKKDFKRAVEKYPREVDLFEKGGNQQITEYFNLYLSVDVKKSLSTNKTWVKACHSAITDNFTKYAVLVKLYSHGTGKTKNRKLLEFVTTQQNEDTFAQFVENLNNRELTNRANFDSMIHPGYISFTDLKAATFLNGLNKTTFKFFLDKFYVDHPTGHVTDLDLLMDSAAVYSREHMVDIKADQYAASLVASTTSITSLKCSSCSVPIPSVIGRHGKPHSRCAPCFRAWLSSKDTSNRSQTAKPGPIVPKLSSAAKTLARANVSSIPTDSVSALTLRDDDESGDDCSDN